ncbi:hypothetical protein ACFL1R_09620 [Candidatus Latescibacterota bacterium]
MTRNVKQKIVISFVLILPVLFAVNCFLYPPEIRYLSKPIPTITSDDPAYSIDEEAEEISYDLGGSSIVVKYMTEKDLNALFATESTQDYYSTNPYTYGNWVDPNLGYIPNRFTVFQVTIINRSFAKMKLDPVEAVFMTDLGEVHHSYTNSIGAARYGKCFEDYYKAIRGQSGNEYYRYDMRTGMVRGKNYGLDELIFRGDTYGGLIAFDPLRPEVKRCRIVLKDIVYRFDAFNRPSDMVTISFDFNRIIDELVVTREMKMKELEREKVRIRMDGPEQLVGNRINDRARDGGAIDRVLADNTEAMETCFIDLYRRDEVDPGNIFLTFTIESDGSVSSQNISEVTGINSENFMNCFLDVIKEIKFEPIKDMPTEGTNIVKGPAVSVNVLYPLDFSIYIEE